MQYEKSCGAVVWRRGNDNKLYILMIRHRHGGNRSFPKGHMERGETEYMTAVREVYKETAVQIRINSVEKEVVYFLTETSQVDIKPREGEIAKVEWVPIEEVERSLTHENDKIIFRAAVQKMREGNVIVK